MKKFVFYLICIIAPSFLWGQNLHKGFMMYGDSSRTGRPFTKDPYVLKWKGSYLMYYSIPESKERGIGWGIGIAESRDLDSWQKVGEINPLQESDLERKGICAPCAIVRNDTIHLFYQIYGNGALDAICHAYSVDGIHFVRNRTNPVFRPSGDWNCGRAIDAEVFEYKGQYFLYYATRDHAYQKQYLGVATTSKHSSFDCDTWKQACSSPILFPELPWEGNCIEAPSLIKRNGKLYMFYAGNYNNAPQQIGIAESNDGLVWTRCSNNPFLAVGKTGEWNSSESGHPGILDDGKLCYLFFQGNNDHGKTWFISKVRVMWGRKGPYIKE